MLTDDERLFCELVVTGVTKTDAYRRVFSVSGLSDSTIRKRVSRLSQRDDIIAEMSQIKTVTINSPRIIEDVPAILSRQELMCRVMEVVESAERDGDKLRGLELYGKLAGYTVPEQAVQVNVGIGSTFSSVMDAVRKNHVGNDI